MGGICHKLPAQTVTNRNGLLAMTDIYRHNLRMMSPLIHIYLMSAMTDIYRHLAGFIGRYRNRNRLVLDPLITSCLFAILLVFSNLCI